MSGASSAMAGSSSSPYCAARARCARPAWPDELTLIQLSQLKGPERAEEERMAYRIVQWGTGLVGGASARRVITHPDYELVGCFAHTESKVGQDVGALVGMDPVGVKATNRIEDVIALKPDCVLYMPLTWDVDHMA